MISWKYGRKKEETEKPADIFVCRDKQSYFRPACVINRYALINGSHYVIGEAIPEFESRSKAEAILKYDLSGHIEPLYDNTGNKAKLAYSEEEIRKSMKRLR